MWFHVAVLRSPPMVKHNKRLPREISSPYEETRSAAFERLCRRLKVEQDERSRRIALRNDMGIVSTRYNASMLLRAYFDDDHQVEFSEFVERIERDFDRCHDNVVLRWLIASRARGPNTLRVAIDQLKAELNEIRSQASEMAEIVTGHGTMDPLDELLFVALPKVYSVYVIDRSSNAWERLTYTPIPNGTNPEGAFVAYIVDVLDDFGLRNSHDGPWTCEAIAQRIERRKGRIRRP